MASDPTLTGRYRYREHKHPLGPYLIVLQVEETSLDEIIPASDALMRTTQWRDATLTDVVPPFKPIPAKALSNG